MTSWLRTQTGSCGSPWQSCIAGQGQDGNPNEQQVRFMFIQEFKRKFELDKDVNTST